MIVCKDCQDGYIVHENNKTIYVKFVSLYTGDVPSVLPKDGTGVQNLPQSIRPDCIKFGAGSTLFCSATGDIYVTDDQGEWRKQ